MVAIQANLVKSQQVFIETCVQKVKCWKTFAKIVYSLGVVFLPCVHIAQER